MFSDTERAVITAIVYAVKALPIVAGVALVAWLLRKAIG
jgi:hypothetical protein